MPTLLDWNALTHKLGVYVGQYDDCPTMQAAFSHVLLEYALGLDPEQIEDAITDGANDRGIDAVYVDDREGRNTIHLFQFKFAKTFTKTKRNFPSNEIDKLLSFCADVLDQNQHLKKSCNPVLCAHDTLQWCCFRRSRPPGWHGLHEIICTIEIFELNCTKAASRSLALHPTQQKWKFSVSYPHAEATHDLGGP